MGALKKLVDWTHLRGHSFADMKKQCGECRKTFSEGDDNFNPIRLVGLCCACIKASPDRQSLTSDLAEAWVQDNRLKDISGRIHAGMKSNVTSGPQQFSLITIIRYGPCTVGDVARHVGLDQSSITLHLRKFENEELVFTYSGDDKRVKMVEATTKAKALYGPPKHSPIPLMR